MLTHLGSQSITANADGSFYSEVRYTAFGETRYTSANGTPTDKLYTGQRLEEEAGLYYYNARFYDAALAHFVQADTVVPNAGRLLSYIRYAYVYFNPVRLTNPTGHYGYEGGGGGVKKTPAVTISTLTWSQWPTVIGATIGGLKQRAEKSGNTVVGELAAEASIMFLHDLWGTDFVQTPMNNAETLFGSDSTFSERIEAATEDYISTGSIVTEYLLIPYPRFIYDSGNSPYFSVNDDFSELSKSSELFEIPELTSNENYLADDISNWVGQGNKPKGFRNSNGDFILIDEANSRRFRFDYFSTSPHENPHMHLEYYVDGKWIKSGPIYPKDVLPK